MILWIALGFVALGGGYFGIGAIVLLRRFTCGRTLEQALAVAKSYNAQNLGVLVNYADEGGSGDRGEAVVDIYTQILDGMERLNIRGDISVKPSSLVDRGEDDVKVKARVLKRRLRLLVDHARLMNRWVWVDEERTADSRWTDPAFRALGGDGAASGLAIRVRAYLNKSRYRLNDLVRSLRRNRIMVGVCRGTYRADRELTPEQTEARIEELLRLCKKEKVPCILASHTLASRAVEMARSEEVFAKPVIHMLHGRREVQEILVPMVAQGEALGGVYLIYGPLLHRLQYGWRRVKERPSLLVWWPREFA